MKYKFIMLFILLSILFAGCHVVPEGYYISKKSASPKILPGFGGITGIVVQGTDNQPVKEVSVHLAEVFRNNEQAAYMFDSANSPSTVTNESGEFTFSSIASGEYVIILGDQMVNSRIIMDDQGKARIWIIQPDQITNTGQVGIIQE